jgi:hypothetical protein
MIRVAFAWGLRPINIHTDNRLHNRDMIDNL